jgi:hypothetical protein
MVVIVAASAVLLRLLALPSPGARYVWWRLALAICLVTPWLLHSSSSPRLELTPVIDEMGRDVGCG